MKDPANVPALDFLMGIAQGVIYLWQIAAVFFGPGSSQGSDRPLPPLPPPRAGTRMQYQSAGHRAQPALHRFGPANGRRLMGQNHKGRLENVLDVVLAE